MSTIAVPKRSEERVGPPPARDLSIDYLRTTLTLMVIGHHSSLAYTSWAYLDKQDLSRSTAPVVDQMRWAFFDYAENFNDVFFMSLMFFISGLFVYPVLRRRGTIGFIRDRFLRLGVPFAFAVVFLMPVAYYASWQLAGHDNGFWNFYARLARMGFAVGPPWFVWVLLFFDMVLAVAVIPLHRWIPKAGSAIERLRDHPLATFLEVLVLVALAYLPLLFRYGFGAWTVVLTAPFAFQVSRIGLYALWFVLGFLAGVPGFANGLLSRDGGLAKRWPLWIGGCILAYNALWFIPRVPVMHRLLGAGRGPLEAVLWVVSCTASCFGFLSLFRGIELHTRAWMLSLTRCAYVMYLVHYIYVLWMQRLILNRQFHAGLKFLFVFFAATFLSWLTAQIALRIPGLRTIL